VKSKIIRKPRSKKIKFSDLGQVDQMGIKTYIMMEIKPEKYPDLSEAGLKFLKTLMGDTDTTGRKYNPQDFITALKDTDKPIKTSLVIKKLALIDEKYANINPTWAREILLRLADEGKVAGELDKNFGGYVWQKKQNKMEE